METRAPLSLASLIGTGVAIACGAGVVAWLAPVLYRWRAQELRAERGWTATPQDTRQTKLAQTRKLEGYAWIDRQKGVVSIPIERAMELVAADSGASAKQGALAPQAPPATQGGSPAGEAKESQR